ncbi:MAG: hypothetical protein M3Y83_16125 [Actinomycetota bacterium]|nr:hypothetical protein [Actinomycetota bacterium]
MQNATYLAPDNRCQRTAIPSATTTEQKATNPMIRTLTGVASAITGASAGAARRHDDADTWMQYARHAATALHNRTGLPEINVYGPVLERGERAFFQGTTNYARMYGGDGTYATTNLFALGSPALMLGAFAASGIINHRRKARARRDATVQWRDHQQAGVIATNKRLMVHTDRGWGMYAYGAITEFYPDIEQATLTIGFGDQGAPMLLAGPPAPAISLLVAAATMPDRWTQDPRLRQLLGR